MSLVLVSNLLKTEENEDEEQEKVSGKDAGINGGKEEVIMVSDRLEDREAAHVWSFTLPDMKIESELEIIIPQPTETVCSSSVYPVSTFDISSAVDESVPGHNVRLDNTQEKQRKSTRKRSSNRSGMTKESTRRSQRERLTNAKKATKKNVANDDNNNWTGEPKKIGKFWSFYKCPFCFLSYTDANRLIEHLSIHKETNIKKSDSKSNQHSNRNATTSGPAVNNHRRGKTEILLKGSTKEMPELRPCKLVLTRCDNMVAPWKLNLAGIPITEEKSGLRVLNRNKQKSVRKASGRTGKVLLNCPTCSKCFPNLKKLKNHRLRQHEMAGRFRCPSCPKSFSHEANLRQHTPIHLKEWLFKCSQCSKGFVHRGNYKRHVRIQHEGIKKFKCSTCSKRFSTLQNFKTHKLLVHS